MTSIPTTADLLRLLREDPDFRDEVRRLVLTQELIELPERFARFEAYVERQFSEIRGDITEMRGDITEMRGDIARLDEGQAQMRQDITEMRGDIARLDEGQAQMRQDIVEIRRDIAKNTSDIGGLKGAEYERRVSRSFTSYASGVFRVRNNRRLRRNRLLLGANRDMSPEFEETLADAVESGQITDDELEDLREADAVMMGIDQTAAVYFVGEFSVTVNNNDIDRAIARAATLGKATGCDVWPMVIGDNIPDPQRARAEAEGVAIRQVAE